MAKFEVGKKYVTSLGNENECVYSQGEQFVFKNSNGTLWIAAPNAKLEMKPAGIAHAPALYFEGRYTISKKLYTSIEDAKRDFSGFVKWPAYEAEWPKL